MYKSFLKNFIIVGLITSFSWGCAPSRSDTPPAESAPAQADATGGNDPEATITLGDVSDDPIKKIKRYQPFAQYLASQLEEVEIKAGSVKVAPDIETMAQLMADGDVDVYFDSPFPAMMVSDLSGAKPILRRWKKGVGSYHTVIFARADSDVETLEDLKGQIIAFDDRVSTSGYMLPLAYLKEAGLETSELDSITEFPEDDKVGYVFSQNDDSSIQWVLSSRVGAAAIGSADFSNLPKKTRDQLRILAETESVPRQLVMVSPTLTQQQVIAIKAVLLAADQGKDSQQVLEQFENTAKFDELPGGLEESFARMHELYELSK